MGETHAPRRLALVGNPNCGKTTLFNALTGLRQKVGNYPGVTVEKKEGRFTVGEREIVVIDLPGVYSLSARSLDERITRDVVLGRQTDTEPPEAILAIADASNLERNLYLVTQAMELGRPVWLALNMMDVAEAKGLTFDLDRLAQALGVPVIPIVANKGVGVEALRQTLAGPLPPLPVRRWRLPQVIEAEVGALAEQLRADHRVADAAAEGEAIRLLLNDVTEDDTPPPPNIQAAVTAARERLEGMGIEWWAAEAEGRYGWIQTVCQSAIGRPATFQRTTSDRIDAVVTHRLWGPVLFAGLMLFVFQSIFTWAQAPMDAIGWAVEQLAAVTRKVLPPGEFNDLAVDGVLAGVGAVMTFLPQILILTFFIALLEDTGYMARAAFIMDRLMRRVGLSGKAFIPLLSSFACAIPGITATRTIENAKDRLVTILIAPLMSCSARLPVYALMIGAFFPAEQRLWGVFSTAGVMLFAMYALGVIAAVAVGWLFKRTLIRGASPPLIMELPPYRIPSPRTVLLTMFSAAGQFLHRAGTVILAIAIVLWFLAAYPRQVALSRDYAAERAAVAEAVRQGTVTEADAAAQLQTLERLEKAERREKSFIGQAGKLIEPLIAPLGFNWKIGVGVLSAFAAREVFVGTLAIVYGVGDDEEAVSGRALHAALQADRHPDGRPVFSPLVAVSVMVFFVLAMQCMSTLAVARRETNSWRWPAVMFVYMTVLAYVGSLLVYQGGRWLGLGE
ncbi:MAG: ferrous iron transport protein B [Chloracidobacterium sp.]|nr:ferrous iron transport protein B [Chloracidobacterium sp.]MDW8217696.1 ferrous iron transport protein B [Acidobacteriota bacterium]